MKMIHHLALNGMETIIVVHMMLYLQFRSTYGLQTLKNGKRYSNQYFSTLHDGFQKYLRGMSTLEAAHCHTWKLFSQYGQDFSYYLFKLIVFLQFLHFEVGIFWNSSGWEEMEKIYERTNRKK